MRGFLIFFGLVVDLWAGLPFFAGQPWLPVWMPLEGATYSLVGVVIGALMFIVGIRSKKKKKDVL